MFSSSVIKGLIILWRSMSARIQLLNFACIFGIRCYSFTIGHNLYLHLQLNIQVSNLSTPIVD